MSALIQYFTLAAMFWMGAEAVLMFKKLVIVFGAITMKHIIMASLIAWRKFPYSNTTGELSARIYPKLRVQ